MKGLIALAVLRLALKLDLGPEYDTNANRAETVDNVPPIDKPTGSALIRTTTKLALSWQRGISLFRLNGALGGKVFFNKDVLDQDTLVGQLGFDERLTLARAFDLGFVTDYYDVGQLDVKPPCADSGCNRHRDFRTGQALARLVFYGGPASFAFSGGWRGFEYKPDESYDFEAAQASASVNLHGTAGAEKSHELDFTASYHFERRWFSGLREEAVSTPDYPTSSPWNPLAVSNGSGRRNDWFHEAAVELSYLGPLLVNAGYAFQLNSSNSFDQTLVRHIVTLRLAARLPWQLYATVKGQVVKNIYFDKLVLGPATQTCLCIEDENRNAIIADLERPIGKTGVAVQARYSFFTNELGTSSVHFTRHVVYLGVSYAVGWRLNR